MKEETQNKFSIKSVIASIALLVIILSATYSYYTITKRQKNYNLTIESNDISLTYIPTANVSADFDINDLTKEIFTIDEDNYGYIESDGVSSSLTLTRGSSSKYATCKYEIWYEPSDTWDGSLDMKLVGREQSTDASAVSNFEFSLGGISEDTKITDAYITSSNGAQNWNFSLRLYDKVTSESVTDNHVSGKVKIKSLGCEAAKLTLDTHLLHLENGTSATVSITNNGYEGEVNVISSDTNVVTASIVGDTITINRVGGGDAKVFVSTSDGGYDAISVDSDVSIVYENLIYANKNNTMDITCSNNGSLTYRAEDGTYVIDFDNLNDITDKVDCNVNYEHNVKDVTKYLNTYVTSLAATTASQTDWKVTSIKGYRYQGEDPDNYIYFNGELWRIIGVFDSSYHGIEDKQLVKIIRNDSLGDYSYYHESLYGKDDTSPIIFQNSDIYQLLNNYYYNALDATGSDVCTAYDNSTNNTRFYISCNFTKNGLNSNAYKALIQDVSIFQNEKASNIKSDDSTVSSAKVSLMTFEDYRYSVLLNDTCTSYDVSGTSSDNQIFYATCKNYFGMTHELLTETTFNSTKVYTVGSTAKSEYLALFDYTNVVTPTGVKPAIYLKDDVYIISGTGTKTDPYIVSR